MKYRLNFFEVTKLVSVWNVKLVSNARGMKSMSLIHSHKMRNGLTGYIFSEKKVIGKNAL